MLGMLLQRSMKLLMDQTRVGNRNPFIIHRSGITFPLSLVHHPHRMEENSHPHDFSTFEPTHDPSLKFPLPSGPTFDEEMPMVTQDEAFHHALSAMYWGGYWTAMYHCQRQMTSKPQLGTTSEADVNEEPELAAELESDREGEGGFVSTQR